MQLTEYSLVFSAVVLPLTYLPILVVANDREYLGEPGQRSGRQRAGVFYLVVIVVVAVAAIPLTIVTGWAREQATRSAADRLPSAGPPIVDGTGGWSATSDDVELTDAPTVRRG
jgi:hypothetical protein